MKPCLVIKMTTLLTAVKPVISKEAPHHPQNSKRDTVI